MKERGQIIKWTSIALALALGMGPLTSAFAASTGAAVTGHVVAAPNFSPMAGAKVHLANAKTGEVLTSSALDSNGGFSVSDIKAGTYHVGVESNGTLYAVDSPISLAPGQVRSLNLQVADKGAAGGEKKKDKAGTPWYDQAWFPTLVIVGSVGLIGAAVANTSDTGTANTPPTPYLPPD